ncbi:MAG TPA: 4Fe-4S binding protein, partial [Polaromonas sp.]
MTALSAAVGDWMQRHGRWIRLLQWVVVLFYGVLVIVPALLPLPDETSRVLTHLTVFAQFVFWGIWWPFVLLSMVLVGRAWCGVLCPEGALTEWVSGKGRNRPIPRWMRWGGWPFVAFVGTTIYGQMVSVYQYPKAVLLVLGGSTLAAMAVGYLYGREKRV